MPAFDVRWIRPVQRQRQFGQIFFPSLFINGGSSGMFWEFFIGRDKGLIPRSGRRYRF
jgi:hypothetical protein